MDKLITITDFAAEHFKRIHEQDCGDPNKAVRLSVVGGGCSGLSYNIGFDEPREKDNVFEKNGVKFVMDPKSTIYMKDLTVDFKDGLHGKGFTFDNPNAKNSCGCGESFSI